MPETKWGAVYFSPVLPFLSGLAIRFTDKWLNPDQSASGSCRFSEAASAYVRIVQYITVSTVPGSFPSSASSAGLHHSILLLHLRS